MDMVGWFTDCLGLDLSLAISVVYVGFEIST